MSIFLSNVLYKFNEKVLNLVQSCFFARTSLTLMNNDWCQSNVTYRQQKMKLGIEAPFSPFFFVKLVFWCIIWHLLMFCFSKDRNVWDRKLLLFPHIELSDYLKEIQNQEILQFSQHSSEDTAVKKSRQKFIHDWVSDKNFLIVIGWNLKKSTGALLFQTLA